MAQRQTSAEKAFRTVKTHVIKHANTKTKLAMSRVNTNTRELTQPGLQAEIFDKKQSIDDKYNKTIGGCR